MASGIRTASVRFSDIWTVTSEAARASTEDDGGIARASARVMPGTHASHHVFERSPGAATTPLPAGYRPRRPQETAFYRVIADHLETMLQEDRDRSPHGFGLPRHVEDSFRRLLDCGIVERGFARVVCPSCQYEILVAFSCKVRGLCPSCDGRWMAAGAADLGITFCRWSPTTGSGRCRSRGGCGSVCSATRRWSRRCYSCFCAWCPRIIPPRAGTWHRGGPDRRGHRDPTGPYCSVQLNPSWLG